MLHDVGVDSSAFTTDPTIQTRFSTAMRGDRIRAANPQLWPAPAPDPAQLDSSDGCPETQLPPTDHDTAAVDPAGATAVAGQRSSAARGLLRLLQKREQQLGKPGIRSEADGTDAGNTAIAGAAAERDPSPALPTSMTHRLPARPSPAPKQPQPQPQPPCSRRRRRRVLHIIPSGWALDSSRAQPVGDGTGNLVWHIPYSDHSDRAELLAFVAMVAPLRATPIVRSGSSDFQRHIRGLCRPAPTQPAPAVAVPAAVERRMAAIQAARAQQPVVMGSAGTSPFETKTVIDVKPRYGAVRHDVADYGGGGGRAKKKRKMTFDGARNDESFPPAIHVAPARQTPGRVLGPVPQPVVGSAADVNEDRAVSGTTGPAPSQRPVQQTTVQGTVVTVDAVPMPTPRDSAELPTRKKGGQRRRRLAHDL